MKLGAAGNGRIFSMFLVFVMPLHLFNPNNCCLKWSHLLKAMTLSSSKSDIIQTQTDLEINL